MPLGFGGTNLGDRVDEALAPVRIDRGAGPNGLAKAALQAVARIATANGHPTPVPPEAKLAVAARKATGGDSGSSLLLFIVPPALALLAALLVARLASRRQTPEEADGSSDQPAP
jgi:hypothetical protein